MSAGERILITGFMAAGKTTVAAALALALDCRMLDLDHFIVEREGRSISAIIDEEGEARFREIEERALLEALANGTARIIALGGGTWMNARNRAAIAEHRALTVWLDAPFELCWKRITSEEEEEEELRLRPLARDRESAQRLYDQRRALYEMADLRVEVFEEKDPDEVAAEIVRAWRSSD